jgi:hypothetical protein
VPRTSSPSCSTRVRNGLRVAPQGTGNNAGPLGSLEDTILLSTFRMHGVVIDAAARRARVAAGTLWLEVTAPASEAGLAPLAGSSPDVGVGRLLARRRGQLAWPQAQPVGQQHPRDRGGGRSCAAAVSGGRAATR